MTLKRALTLGYGASMLKMNLILHCHSFKVSQRDLALE
jgi:hypothetical protein